VEKRKAETPAGSWPFVIAVITLLILYLLPLIWLFPWTLEKLEKRDIVGKADVIVILEGTIHRRIDHAFELSEQGFASVIYYPNPFYEANRKYFTKRKEETKDSIWAFSGPGAESTFEEAVKTKKFCLEHGYNSLILVTSPYHSYRAWWIFRLVMPDIRVISSPAPYEKPWEANGVINEKHRHVRYAVNERVKFFLYYLLFNWRSLFSGG
jgi:hypothetical protein